MFLNKWCQLYPCQYKWLRLDFEILDHHWDDIASWWLSDDVREVVNQFIKNYFYSPGDISGRIVCAFQEVVKTSMRRFQQ